MSELKNVKDEKCIECNEQAVVLWPINDPNIPSNPYCRKCVDTIKLNLLLSVFSDDKKKKK